MKKRACVLIVDDHDDNVYFLRALLQGHGCKVVTAHHGAEALEASRAEPPDLVIADILMPVMDGFALCREWRKDERLRRIPFIFYTATYTDERDREFALSLGADRFVLKPEDPDTLVVMVRDLIEEAERRPALPPAPRPSIAAKPVEETVYLKQYSEALVRKLEAKTLQLEQSVRAMQQDIAARKQAEESLRSSEIRFRELFNNMTSGAAVYEAGDDGADFIFKDLNEAGSRINQVKKEDVVGRLVTEVFPGIRQMGLLDVFRRVWRTGRTEFLPAAQYAHEDLSAWYENHVYKLPSGEVVAIYDDVTARKLSEEALRKSEQKFYKAFTVSPVPMAISALDDGVYLDINKAFIEEIGLTREEVIGKSAVEMGFWTLEQRQAILREAAAGHPIRNVEISVKARDGRILPGLFSADPLELDGRACWLTVFVDISARKEAEQALTDEVARRRILVEQSRDGIVVLDQDGSVLEANRKYGEMLGYTPEEIRHLHVWDWDAKWPKEKLLKMLRDVSASGDHFETEHRRKDGSWFPVEISTNGAEIGGRKLIFCVCRDITERKDAEAKMQKQLAELRQWYSVTLDREERVVELKREVDQLLSRLGEKAKYGIG